VLVISRQQASLAGLIPKVGDPPEPAGGDLPTIEPNPLRDPVGQSDNRGARVLLADDHFLILDMIEELIRHEFTVTGIATDGRSLLATVHYQKPDIILADITMPIMNGLDAGRVIKERWPGIKLIYITADPDPALAAQAFSVGAEGYLLKHCPASELLRALRTVRDGGVYLTRLIADGDRDSLRRRLCPRSEPRLSARELEVIALLVRGLPMKEVARRLGITPRTVAFHKYNAMSTLGLQGNADLLRYAVQIGLLSQMA
jgi:DNA-binding NarL/FixJ family response regulator